MKQIAFLFLIFASSTAPSQQIASIDIESEYTRLVQKTPIVVVAEENAAYWDFEITGPGGVEKNESLNKLTITAIKNGDYEVSVKALFVNFDEKKTTIKESKLKFRVDIRGPPVDDEEPADPVDDEEPGDDAGLGELKSLTTKLAKAVNDSESAKLLAAAYEKTIAEIKDVDSINKATEIASKNAKDAMQSRLQFGFNWNPVFNQLWAKMKDIEADKAIKKFRSALRAIADGLKEATK